MEVSRQDVFGRGSTSSSKGQKAEGASWTALCIPNPTSDTGREAWSQADSPVDIQNLTHRLVIECRMLLNSINLWELKHGEVLSKNRILGMEKA